jgi:hypothetical protein
MSIIKGYCPKCGAHYFGWALSNPDHQSCLCGGPLQVQDDFPLSLKLVDPNNAATTELPISRLISYKDMSLTDN